MSRQTATLKLLNLLQLSVRTTHARIITCGLLIGFCYLFTWCTSLIKGAMNGTDLLLVPTLAYLGLQSLWKQRHGLAQLKASPENQQLGYVLILTGCVVYPFCRFDVWSQTLVWIIVLFGMATSTWGLSFFRNYPVESTLLLFSTYPNLGFAARAAWRALTPDRILEKLMAWSGSLGLRLVGQAATAQGHYLTLPRGSVEIAFGCNGFDMAFTLAIAGIILGLLFHQSWLTIVGLSALGVGLALVLNIPRIMLLAIASIYWGKSAFQFWHGSIGGQIFSTLLLTIYYYAAMWVIQKHPAKATD